MLVPTSAYGYYQVVPLPPTKPTYRHMESRTIPTLLDHA